MSKYPDVILSDPVIVQSAITTTSFHVVQVAENPDEQWVDAFVFDGVNKIWVRVLNSDTYYPDWSDVDVINGISSYVTQNYQRA
jgi:hypothetical protein